MGCCACLWAEGALLVLLHKHEQVSHMKLAEQLCCLLHEAADRQLVCDLLRLSPWAEGTLLVLPHEQSLLVQML